MIQKNINNIILIVRGFLIPLYLFIILAAGCQSQSSEPIVKGSPTLEKQVTLGPQTRLIDPETARKLKADYLLPDSPPAGPPAQAAVFHLAGVPKTSTST